ncbi:LysR family transcriptional regulator [Altericroceibacterium endophyticum]|uniref:LysR family transcriptional regulator n=1 Tax=Altericroceibacterium endophyticum TaxID=1808508 RepID=A0A6I4TAK2_9SPHN|nr:LysR family transcriptional regulator [Altericroceibacterium endophyticum]MXO67053.1 LysR family transcriptional regulator [Altericroceibacterium endophyticum]
MMVPRGIKTSASNQDVSAVVQSRSLDLNLLKALVVLLHTKSVTGAARKLGVSQPAVSRSLAQLRNLFQDQLLFRTNRGMELTRRAEDLLHPLQEWQELTCALLARPEFNPAAIHRTFRIAATDFGAVSVLAPAMAAFHAAAPHARMEMVAFSENMTERLKTGDLDLIITGSPPEFSATYGRHLFTDQCVCAMRHDHPLLAENPEQVPLEEFLRWPHVSIVIEENSVDPINRFIGDYASQRQIIAVTPYFRGATHFLANSNAILTLPASMVQPAETGGIVTRRPPSLIPAFDYWMLWNERNRRDYATQWLVDLLSTSASAHSPDA